MNPEIRAGWPGGGDLVRDYLAGRERATRFFARPFQEDGALEAHAAALDGRSAEWRARAAHVLRSANPEARARIDAWEAEDGFVVTTGQQPGLLTGPLFAVHKALTALALARRWSERLGRPVLPVFWVASEDHDWEEANHAWLLDDQERPQRIEARPAEPPAGRPLFRVPLAGRDALLDQLADLIPDKGFGADCLEQVRAAYPERCTLPDGFTHLLRTWLGPLGLLVLRADEPALKEASAALLHTELDRSQETEAVLRERAQALATAGYGVQVHILDGALNLFFEGPAGRERIYRDGDGLYLHGSGTRIDRDDLRARCAADPSLLSPNVLLRPVVESAVLPVLAYVAGPGELAYWAELDPLFRTLDVPMPLVHPRLSVTVVEPQVRRILDKRGLAPEDLARPEHELTSDLARQEMPVEARTALARLRSELTAGTDALSAAIRALDPTLEGPITHARTAALRAVDKAETKILRAVKREKEVLLRQVDRARQHLAPLGAPQERVLNAVQYLARYGPGLLTDLLERCEAVLDAGAAVAAPAEPR